MSKPGQADQATNIDTGDEGIIWAFRFGADGSAQAIGRERINEALAEPGGWIWIHLGLADHRCRVWIAERAPLSQAAREVLTDAHDHLRLDIFGDEIAGVLPDLQRDLSHPTDEIVRLHFVITEHFLITARRNRAHAVDVARRSIDTGRRFPTAISFLDAIIDQFADAIVQMIDMLEDELDVIEQRLLHHELSNERDQLGRVRMQAVRMHRQLAQLRSLFHRIEPKLLQQHQALAQAIGALAQKLDALDYDVTALHARARLLLDEVVGKMTEVTNQRLYLLSILTACLLPPTLVTGFFGMNTKDMPFQNSDGGTWLALAVAVAAGALSYWVLRRMRVL